MSGIYLLGILANLGILSSISDDFKLKEWCITILFSLLSWVGILIISIIGYDIPKKLH